MENKEEKMQMCRHSLSHVLAKAVKNLFGKENVKLAIGPSIDNGFYYDFDIESIPQEKYVDIEKEIKSLKKRQKKEKNREKIELLKKDIKQAEATIQKMRKIKFEEEVYYG